MTIKAPKNQAPKTTPINECDPKRKGSGESRGAVPQGVCEGYWCVFVFEGNGKESEGKLVVLEA